MTELTPEIVELEPQEVFAVRGDVAIADLPEFFERAFREAAEAAAASGVQIVGPPVGFYPGMPAETVVVEAGFPAAARSKWCTSVRTALWRRPTGFSSRGWRSEVSALRSGCGSATCPTRRSSAIPPRGGRRSFGRSLDARWQAKCHAPPAARRSWARSTDRSMRRRSSCYTEPVLHEEL